MTKLLQQALAQVENLPDPEQDAIAAIAAIIIEELTDERRWQDKFAGTQDFLSKLAAKAEADIRAGKVQKMGFDEM